MARNSDPRLIKRRIKSLQIVLKGFDREFNEARAKIKDRNVVRALISLKIAVGYMDDLLQIILEDYLQELSKRIAELEED
ncbi:MAG: hypothetical protein BMS9Abin34_108 [Patescibacteria group bacterium]|nr:MAG: hypothetical protein BMS9Abin34_108 [Patescibacteria group bacterium]